jgi:hypothetical protein
VTAKMKFNGKKPQQKVQKQNLDQQKQRNQSLYVKYLALGKDSISQGDNIEAERNFQHAEHYIRLLNDIADLDGNVMNRACTSSNEVDNLIETVNYALTSVSENIDHEHVVNKEQKKQQRSKGTRSKTSEKYKSNKSKNILVDVANGDGI